jgi:hypothetical protein
MMVVEDASQFVVEYPSKALRFLVTGAEKHPMIVCVRRGNSGPAGRQSSSCGELWWFLDGAVANGKES